jgi:uncharacterized membrane protein YphA (DoxX/SURF4 family)
MALWDTREHRTELLLACLRSLVGIIFLSVFSYNLTKGYYSPHGWATFVQHYADTTAVGPYRSFLDNVMIPNAAIAARSQFVLELIVGVFLVIGLLTPLAGLLGALFQLNLLAATSGISTDWPGTYIIMAALLLAIALGQAGRTLGVDARLSRRDPQPRLPLY